MGAVGKELPSKGEAQRGEHPHFSWSKGEPDLRADGVDGVEGSWGGQRGKASLPLCRPEPVLARWHCIGGMAGPLAAATPAGFRLEVAEGP